MFAGVAEDELGKEIVKLVPVSGTGMVESSAAGIKHVNLEGETCEVRRKEGPELSRTKGDSDGDKSIFVTPVGQYTRNDRSKSSKAKKSLSGVLLQPSSIKLPKDAQVVNEIRLLKKCQQVGPTTSEPLETSVPQSAVSFWKSSESFDPNDTLPISSNFDRNDTLRNSSKFDPNDVVRNNSNFDRHDVVRNSSNFDRHDIVRISSNFDRNSTVRNSTNFEQNNTIRNISNFDRNDSLRNSSNFERNDTFRNSSNFDRNDALRSSSNFDQKGVHGSNLERKGAGQRGYNSVSAKLVISYPSIEHAFVVDNPHRRKICTPLIFEKVEVNNSSTATTSPTNSGNPKNNKINARLNERVIPTETRNDDRGKKMKNDSAKKEYDNNCEKAIHKGDDKIVVWKRNTSKAVLKSGDLGMTRQPNRHATLVKPAIAGNTSHLLLKKNLEC